MTLPVVDEVELETLIDQRTTALIRQIDTTSNLHSNSVRGQIAVQFFEKKRRKAWFSKAEEEICWEQWTLDVTLATPKTESGTFIYLYTIIPFTRSFSLGIISSHVHLSFPSHLFFCRTSYNRLPESVRYYLFISGPWASVWRYVMLFVFREMDEVDLIER